MSDSSDKPLASSNAETEAALARLAAFNKGNGGNRETTSRSGGAGALLLGMIFVVLLVAVGGLAWLQFAQMDELTSLRNDYTALQQLSAGSTNQFAVLQEGQQELSTTLAQEQTAANAALATQAQQLTSLESELAGTRLRVNSMNAGGSPLAEAEVLLRFAQQRLLLARDTTTAIELFQAADELLSDINDPQVVTLREVLAREVAELQALPIIDVAGLFAQLSTQAVRIENFAVVSASAGQEGIATVAVEAATAESGWWNRLKQTLGEYFVVTRNTETIKPQLDTEEQYLIRTLVQLHIEQAKLALLRAEPQLYQAALDEALATSRQWLSSTDGSYAEFVAALATLRNTPIVIEIPGANQTLTALRELPGAAPLALPAIPPDPEPLPESAEPVAAIPASTSEETPEAQQ